MLVSMPIKLENAKCVSNYNKVSTRKNYASLSATCLEYIFQSAIALSLGMETRNGVSQFEIGDKPLTAFRHVADSE